MDAESLVKLLGPSRVAKHERSSGYLLLVPPAGGVEVKAYRERFTRLSTELAWVFVAAARISADCEAAALGRPRGILMKRWSWEIKGKDAEKLQMLLNRITNEEPLAVLFRKAKPEYVSITVNDGEALVKVVKAIIGPYAGPLREAYDLSWKLAVVLTEEFN